jgi:integrase
VFTYEVMRRPVTTERLRRPQHWRPEYGPKLLITPDIDKNGKKRVKRDGKPVWVPLSPVAYEIIQRRATRDGLIFGKFYRTATRYLREAALAIGMPADIAAKVSPYDSRHNTLRHAVDATGDLRGVSAQSGTSIATLSKDYLDSDLQQASRMIAARESSPKNLKLVRLPIPPPSREKKG